MKNQPIKSVSVVVSLVLWSLAGGAQTAPRVAMPGIQASNAFWVAAAELGLAVDTRAEPDPASCDALVLCAPAYPKVTPLCADAQRAMERFLAAGKAVYVEYAPLPGLMGGARTNAVFGRLLVTTPLLQADGLAPLTILEEHASCYLPPLGTGGSVWLSYAHVAGVDRAVFGAPAETVPAVFERAQGAGRLLAATTALSNWERGRYRPTAAWQALLRAVLVGLLPAQKAAAIRQSYVGLQAWTEPREWVAPGEAVRLHVRATPGSTVRVTGASGAVELHALTNGLFASGPFTPPPGPHRWQVQARRGEALREATLELAVSPRAERYRETVARNLRWFERAKMLIAPDGSKGVREGFGSQVNPDGKPRVAGCVRVDCVSECALAFRTYGLLTGDDTWLQRGNRMLEYTSRAFQCTSRDCWYFGHWQSRNEFRDDGSTVYVFNDDSGAGTLFSLLGYASTGEAAQLRAGLRGVEYFAHVASEKTGFFGWMMHRDYKGSGRMGTPWPKMRAMNQSSDKPHVVNLPQASLLAAYLLTGEPRYLEIAERGLRTLMTIYPKWPIQTSRTCEHSRMLLPLTLLLKASPTAEHRAWLDTIVGYLAGKQAPCGALIEWDGINPTSNASHGTAETSIFQQNGDPISDQLYNSGFAVFHLGLAYRVTGDERIGQIYRRLGDYLSRIQMSDPDPLYDGTWLRAFDYSRWEYFGSSADIGWGPYCVETGWQCAPLIMGLMLEMAPVRPGEVLSLPQKPDARLKPAVEAARQEADAVEATLTRAQPAGAIPQKK